MALPPSKASFKEALFHADSLESSDSFVAQELETPQKTLSQTLPDESQFRIGLAEPLFRDVLIYAAEGWL